MNGGGTAHCLGRAIKQSVNVVSRDVTRTELNWEAYRPATRAALLTLWAAQGDLLW